MSNLQLHKLKLGIKNGTEVTLNLSSNVISDSNYETNFPHKLLLTDTQVSRFLKILGNNSLSSIKLSKIQLSKMVQLGGVLGLSLMKNVLKPLSNSVVVPLGLAAAASAIDAGILKKNY